MKILFCLAIFAVFVTVALAGDDKDKDKDKDKVTIPGDYKLETDPDNDDLIEYLVVMGFSEKWRKRARKTKELLVEIKKLNETHFQINKVTKKKTCNMTFESGKQFEDKFPDGRKVNTTITINKKEKTIKRVILMDGFNATHDAKFGMKGFNITLKAKDAKAKLMFSRIEKKRSFGEAMSDFFRNLFGGGKGKDEDKDDNEKDSESAE